jgi:hypothetical protein
MSSYVIDKEIVVVSVFDEGNKMKKLKEKRYKYNNDLFEPYK